VARLEPHEPRILPETCRLRNSFGSPPTASGEWVGQADRRADAESLFRWEKSEAAQSSAAPRWPGGCETNRDCSPSQLEMKGAIGLARDTVDVTRVDPSAIFLTSQNVASVCDEPAWNLSTNQWQRKPPLPLPNADIAPVMAPGGNEELDGSIALAAWHVPSFGHFVLGAILIGACFLLAALACLAASSWLWRRLKYTGRPSDSDSEDDDSGSCDEDEDVDESCDADSEGSATDASGSQDDESGSENSNDEVGDDDDEGA
jgi:hypothetical protein